MDLMGSNLALFTLFLLHVRKDNGQLCRVSSLSLLTDPGREKKNCLQNIVDLISPFLDSLN